MISQSLYFRLQAALDVGVPGLTESERLEISDFVEPYVFVIHRPTKQGFYFDRYYTIIVAVRGCEPPTTCDCHLAEHRSDFQTTPDWVKQQDSKSFDTFWFYH